MKKKLLFGLLGVAAVVAAVVAFGGGKTGETTVETIRVKRGEIRERALAVGTIEPEKEIKVKSTISGIVSSVLFEVGDKVKKGQALFKINPNPTPVEYVDAMRTMQAAEVAKTHLYKEWQRRKELFAEKLISPSEMETVEAQYRECEVKYNQARERFELLENGKIRSIGRPIDSVVYSPIGGVILAQNVYDGDPVVPLTNFQPGTELATMADMGRFVFKGTVDEIDVGKLDIGMSAELQIGALPTTRVSGRLRRIHPKAKKDGNATIFDIDITIVEVVGRLLRAGYSATAYITVAQRRDVLVIPERLLIFADGGHFVFVQRGEKAVKTAVQVGLTDSLNAEIISGLREGDILPDGDDATGV